MPHLDSAEEILRLKPERHARVRQIKMENENGRGKLLSIEYEGLLVRENRTHSQKK